MQYIRVQFFVSIWASWVSEYAEFYIDFKSMNLPGWQNAHKKLFKDTDFRLYTIDISWVDWVELTSLLPVTSCIVDSAVIDIMVVEFRNIICLPPPQLSLHRRAALSCNSNGTRSVYSRKNPKSSIRILWYVYAVHREPSLQTKFFILE
jgi:hypothetical protein